MPPRFAYWTILIDNQPTAFRAREAQELLPTLAQLKRTNPNAVMMWFARGRLWASPEAEREAQRRPKPMEKRGAAWRPGGAHVDPRDRFKKKTRDRPWTAKSPAAPKRDRPFTGKPPGAGAPRGNRQPWRDKRDSRGRPDRPDHAMGARSPSKPWTKRPLRDRKPFAPRTGPPRSAPPSNERRRRDDEPPDHD